MEKCSKCFNGKKADENHVSFADYGREIDRIMDKAHFVSGSDAFKKASDSYPGVIIDCEFCNGTGKIE